MKIQELASKPKLIEIVLDDANLVETYGEPITFYTYDIVGMSTYFDFYNSRANSEFETLAKLIRKMILDENGKPVLSDDKDLPMDIMTACIIKVGEILGKQQGKKSTPTTGEAQA